ncbi:alpha-1,4 glucan phosphorylase L-2 isozyme, chloroplastic/amyloplastic-like protein [Tanacetum coccineum]
MSKERKPSYLQENARWEELESNYEDGYPTILSDTCPPHLHLSHLNRNSLFLKPDEARGVLLANMAASVKLFVVWEIVYSKDSSVKEMGNPCEIPRNDVSYSVKYYGEFVMGPDGQKELVGGENIMAVAYDVPTPGYKTKTTINLRLWSTTVAPEYFDLDAFNSKDHPKAYEALKRVEKICLLSEFSNF